jgi:hypothetical protein
MAVSQLVSAKVREVVEVAARALNSEASLPYENFDATVRELETFSREAFQAKVGNDYRSILHKLDHKQRLNEHELQMLELLIVGGAKYYLKYENDLDNWRAELGRLVEEMEKVESGGLDDIDSLLHLEALCRDAKGVLPDVTYYYRENERLNNYRTAISGPLSAEDQELLAEVLRSMMQSVTM